MAEQVGKGISVQPANATLVTRRTLFERGREQIQRAISRYTGHKHEAPSGSSRLRTGLVLGAAVVLSLAPLQAPKQGTSEFNARTLEEVANTSQIRRHISSFGEPLLGGISLGPQPAYAEEGLVALDSNMLRRQGIYLNGGNSIRVGEIEVLGIETGKATDMIWCRFPDGKIGGVKLDGFDGRNGYAMTGGLINGLPTFYIVENSANRLFRIQFLDGNRYTVDGGTFKGAGAQNPSLAVANKFYFASDGHNITMYPTDLDDKTKPTGIPLDTLLQKEGIAKVEDLKFLSIAAANDKDKTFDYVFVAAPGFRYLHFYIVTDQGIRYGALPVAPYNNGNPIQGRPRIYIGKNPETGKVSCVVLDPDPGGENLLVYNEGKFTNTVLRKEMGYVP